MTITAYTLCTIYTRQVTTLAFSTPVDVINIGNKQTYTSGTGNYQVRFVYTHQGTLTGGSSVTFNIKSGTLKDNLGNQLVFTKLKSVYFSNLTTAHTWAACLGSCGNNNVLMAFKMDKVYCYGKSQLFLTSPIAGVSCASIFRVLNTVGTTITYNMILIGT